MILQTYMNGYEAKILAILTEETNGVSVLEVSEKLGLNRNSTARYLEAMEHQGLVSQRKIGPARLYIKSDALPFTVQLDLFKKAMDVASCGITIADAQQDDMPLIYINEAFEKMTGYSSSEVLGKNCRFLQGDGDNATQTKIIRDAIKNKEGCTVRLENFTKSGVKFLNLLRLSPIFDEQGVLTHYVGIQTVKDEEEWPN